MFDEVDHITSTSPESVSYAASKLSRSCGVFAYSIAVSSAAEGSLPHADPDHCIADRSELESAHVAVMRFDVARRSHESFTQFTVPDVRTGSRFVAPDQFPEPQPVPPDFVRYASSFVLDALV